MKSFLVVLLLVLGAIAATLAVPKTDPKPLQGLNPELIGGDKLEPYSQPWLVSMDLIGAGLYECVGVLISQNYVLTSAGCTAYAEEGFVRFGLDNVVDPNPKNIRKIKASNFLTHPDYGTESARDHNFGLVKLDEPVEIDEFVQIATLIRPEDGASSDLIAADVDLIAWDDDGDLAKMTTKILTLEECDDSFTLYIYEGNYCYDNRHGDGCGSSGAPIFHNGTVVALHSLSITGCYAGYNAVAEQILSGIDWILENTDL